MDDTIEGNTSMCVFCVCDIWMSKLNIIIEWKEKNNTGEKSVNTIFPFHNVLPNLQCVASTLIFCACHFSISYRVSNLIGSVLRTNNKVDGLLFVSQIKSFLSSSFPLIKYINGSFLLIIFLYVYVIWCKREYNIWF